MYRYINYKSNFFLLAIIFISDKFEGNLSNILLSLNKYKLLLGVCPLGEKVRGGGDCHDYEKKTKMIQILSKSLL